MANAKICDVCGKYYTRYNWRTTDTGSNSIAFFKEDGDRDYINMKGYIDLCPECKKSIEDHIKFLGTKEVN